MNTGQSHVGREGRRGGWGEERQAMRSEEEWKKDWSLDLDWKRLGLENLIRAVNRQNWKVYIRGGEEVERCATCMFWCGPLVVWQ